MSKAEMFHLLWQAFVDTGVMRSNADDTHKVLYRRSDGHWALKYVYGADWVVEPTLEELMLAVIRRESL